MNVTLIYSVDSQIHFNELKYLIDMLSLKPTGKQLRMCNPYKSFNPH